VKIPALTTNLFGDGLLIMSSYKIKYHLDRDFIFCLKLSGYACLYVVRISESIIGIPFFNHRGQDWHSVSECECGSDYFDDHECNKFKFMYGKKIVF
jgi:hypothetical protein